MKFFNIMVMLFTCLLLQKTFAISIKIVTYHQQYPWVSSKDGGKTLEGISTDIIKLTMKESDIDYTITNYPWPRAYWMTEHNKDTCIYPTAFTEQRKKSFKWIGPIGENIFTFFAKKGSKIKLTKLEDAKNYSIGTSIGSAITEILKKKNFTKLHEVSENNRILMMLINSRVDLWASNKAEAIKTALTEKQMIEEKLVFGKSQLYLACNKSIDNSIINSLNKSLNNLKESGSLNKIK